jgi:putative transposase
MPRRPRLDVPGIPIHVTHRGVNRVAVFLRDSDCRAYLDDLGAASAAQGLRIHAYVLMTNHVHLLASAEEGGALSRIMREVGQRYVPRFNRQNGRTGTLWEGRFKSCLVDSDSYLLSVYRYIELNPVRAGMVAAPVDYPWSSARANLGVCVDPLVTPHSCFLALSSQAETRHRAYERWLASASAPAELDAIRRHTGQERALGAEPFQAHVARLVNRPVAVRPRGRPRSAAQ